jgi:hypothetical protein
MGIEDTKKQKAGPINPGFLRRTAVLVAWRASRGKVLLTTRSGCTVDPAGGSNEEESGACHDEHGVFRCPGPFVVYPDLGRRLDPDPASGTLELRESHSTAIGIIYAALYVMFGVMVGFSAYLVLNKYDSSQKATQNEAGDVVELYRLADQFPQPQRDRIQELAASYARAVVDEEWPLMRQGQTSSRANSLAGELQRSVEGFEPSTSAEQTLYSQALERVHDLDQDRQTRMLYVREGLPPILWVVLSILGAATILFAYFLGMKNAWVHSLAVAALTAGIVLVVFTIVTLDSPFGTDLRVGPTAFEAASQTMEGNDEQGT